MQDWIERAVKERETEESNRNKERDWQIHKSSVLASKAPVTWESVISAVERDISELNASGQFGNIQFQKSANGFIARRPQYPAISLRVEFHSQTHDSECLYTKTDTSGASPRVWRSKASVDMDSHGEIYMRIGSELCTTDEASQSLLSAFVAKGMEM